MVNYFAGFTAAIAAVNYCQLNNWELSPSWGILTTCVVCAIGLPILRYFGTKNAR